MCTSMSEVYSIETVLYSCQPAGRCISVSQQSSNSNTDTSHGARWPLSVYIQHNKTLTVTLSSNKN